MRYRNNIPREVFQSAQKEKYKACIICGLGSSLEQITPREDIYYIGVNDICRVFTPELVYIADRISNTNDYRKQFGTIEGTIINKRIKVMLNTNSEWLFTPNTFEFPNTKQVHVIGKEIVNSYYAMKEALKYQLIWHNSSSIIGAISIGFMLGFKTIGIIGFDLYGNHIFKNTKHKLIEKNHIEALNRVSEMIFRYACEEGVSISNLSKYSKIVEFPKMESNDFYDLLMAM